MIYLTLKEKGSTVELDSKEYTSDNFEDLITECKEGVVKCPFENVETTASDGVSECTIEGRVVDDETNKAVGDADVLVEVYNKDGVKTDSYERNTQVDGLFSGKLKIPESPSKLVVYVDTEEKGIEWIFSGDHLEDILQECALNGNGQVEDIEIEEYAVSGSPTSADPKKKCQSDEDCPSNEICISDECVARSDGRSEECEDDEDCGNGERCEDNKCVAIEDSEENAYLENQERLHRDLLDALRGEILGPRNYHINPASGDTRTAWQFFGAEVGDELLPRLKRKLENPHEYTDAFILDTMEAMLKQITVKVYECDIENQKHKATLSIKSKQVTFDDLDASNTANDAKFLEWATTIGDHIVSGGDYGLLAQVKLVITVPDDRSCYESIAGNPVSGFAFKLKFTSI